MLLERLPRDEGDAPHVFPRDTWARIEIDAQFIGMIEVVRADRVRVQLKTAKVRHPSERGGVPRDNLGGGATRGKADRYHFQPRWP